MDFNFIPNDEMKKILTEAAEQFSAALISSAFVSAAMQVVKAIIAPKTTRIELDNSVPVEVFAMKDKKGNPECVFVSSKKRHISFAPAIFMALLGLGVHYVLNASDNESKGETVKTDAV